MKMSDAFKPSILVSETHNAHVHERDVIADAVARVAAEGFYLSIEIADVPGAGDRKRIGDTIRESGIALTQWMSMTLAEGRLNLSSVDEALRRKSVARMKEMIGPALECGTRTLAVLSGPDPGPALRAQATGQLYASLMELCEALEEHAPMRLILEPLDREAHKNGLLGPTAEFVALFRRIRKTHPSAGVSWDSAHVSLCREDFMTSFEEARDVAVGIHLANAVLDPRDERFGDSHMDVGPPGFLTVEGIANLFRRGIVGGLFSRVHPPIAVEIRTAPGGDPWQTEARGRAVLEEAWAISRSGETTR